MLPAEKENLRLHLERHSQETTLYGRTCRVVNFETLANERLGTCPNSWGWCYYNDEPAHEFFDDLMDSGLVHYYAAPREYFSPITGMEQANDAGKRYVILEDMS